LSILTERHVLDLELPTGHARCRHPGLLSVRSAIPGRAEQIPDPAGNRIASRA
jgi:hypothetical protein